MATVARITKNSELISKDKINERLPVITNGLLSHYPLDNNLGIAGYRSLKNAKVLGAYYNSGDHPTYSYISNNCYSFTHSDDLTAVTIATAKTYDLIVYDGVYWDTPVAVMSKIKEFVDAGVSAIAVGNDTNNNCFMNVAAISQAAHTLVTCNNSFIDVSSLNGVPGFTDPTCAISELLEPRSYPIYRRSDTNHISGFIYEGLNGGAFYFDHEGATDDKTKYRFLYEYILSKSVGRTIITNSFATPTRSRSKISITK